MSDAGRLAADWLTGSVAADVMAALEALRPGGSRFVGGCVRNTLMGRPVDDIDIATQLTPDEVIAGLGKVDGIRVIPTGVEHGTVTAVLRSTPVEITTLRRDVETDGRRAVIAFTEDWDEDAQRRDFRLNAIYAGADGTLFDPTGKGVEDARAGRVIFIGDADQRLREDYLRILRFFRFNAWYGAKMDTWGLVACKRHKDGLKRISAERIWKELKKLLEAPDPVLAVHAMRTMGVLKVVLGVEQDVMGALVNTVQGEKALGLPPDPVRRLAAIVGAAEGLAECLRLSKAEAERLAEAADTPGIDANVSDSELRCMAYRSGKRRVEDGLIQLAAFAEDADAIRAKLEAVRAWTPPEFPLTGHDALEAGLKGAEIGERLRVLEEAWVASDFALSRDKLRAKLRQTGQ